MIWMDRANCRLIIGTESSSTAHSVAIKSEPHYSHYSLGTPFSRRPPSGLRMGSESGSLVDTWSFIERYTVNDVHLSILRKGL